MAKNERFLRLQSTEVFLDLQKASCESRSLGAAQVKVQIFSSWIWKIAGFSSNVNPACMCWKGAKLNNVGRSMAN